MAKRTLECTWYQPTQTRAVHTFVNNTQTWNLV